MSENDREQTMLARLNQHIKNSAAYHRYKHSVGYVRLKDWQKALTRRLRLPRYLGNTFCCPICGTHLRAFKPLSPNFENQARQHAYHPLSALETFNYKAYYCPSCGASDRERLYALYLDGVFLNFDRTRRYRVVEFAPSPGLQRKLRSYPFIDYRSADLFRQTVDDRTDICEMRVYADRSVDVFLCSHVLEHVSDDRKAMAEIFRVLHPDGFGVLLVPLVHGVEDTVEDPAIVTASQRWRYYGSDDHVRQYGKRDFIGRLASAGFQIDQVDISHFGAEAFRRAGIALDSVLYVIRKGPPS
jgi:SAM-dependent methyltransferase